jgi:hypothetical protein
MAIAVVARWAGEVTSGQCRLIESGGHIKVSERNNSNRFTRPKPLSAKYAALAIFTGGAVK